MSKRNIEAIYPLSPMQQGMLFHTLYAPDSEVYMEQTIATLRGPLDAAPFAEAWRAMLQRHTILRTSFAWKKLEQMLQIVHKQVELPFHQEDLRALDPEARQARLDAFVRADRQQGFNLARPPLLRLALFRLADDVHQVIISAHHIIMDGWSLPLLVKELMTAYESLAQGQRPSLPPTRPYRDYINWLQQQDQDAAAAFWRRQLRGFHAPTPLVVDRPQPDAYGYREKEVHLSEATTTQLQQLARQHQVTLNTLFQAAYALLLHRYSGEEDVVFGATVSGRPADLPGAESIIGLFINTLPVRVPFTPELTVAALLKQLMAQQGALRQYEYSSLVQIQEWSDVPQGTPLFNSILVFENYPVDETLRQQQGSVVIDDAHAIEQTNYPLTVVSGPGREMVLKVSYDRGRFADATIDRLLGHLQTILESIAANPTQPVTAVPLLTPAEVTQSVQTWNDNATPFDVRLVHEWFEETADRFPDTAAVVSADAQLTYRELDGRANQLAHFLQKQGVGPESVVAICMDHSLEMIVAAVGVLKAGCAYLPLDPANPADRLAYMLADSRAQVLLTQEELLAISTLADFGARIPSTVDPSRPAILCLDADWNHVAQQPTTKPVSNVTPANLAYVIYTSGSTGLPKGTLLEHRGLCNYANAFVPILGIDHDTQALLFSSFSFDAATADIFMTLLSGATLHLAPRQELMAAEELRELLQKRAISFVTLPPTMWRALPEGDYSALQSAMSAGEALTPEVAARWAPGRRFFNGYGPTENTIGASVTPVKPSARTAVQTAISHPPHNIRAYVLDAEQRPVPIGVPGELCLAGASLSRGYLGRPSLTAEKFLPDPLSATPGARMYRTGDLVAWRPDGSLDFLGRIDFQVKIRGYRVELGEIEALLGEYPGLQETAVIAQPAGAPAEQTAHDLEIVAYVVPQPDHAPDAGALREFLSARLPDYMLPARYVVLQEMPLTPSGKIDRRRLPAQAGEQLVSAAAYVAPRTPTEELLANIWSQVLGAERVGARDNFFELGGHSLLATRLATRLRDAFAVEVPLRLIFERPTVAELAETIQAMQLGEELSAPPIEPVARDGAQPLSFAQQRLWFLDQLEPNSPYYNIPTAVRLSGDLDVAALRDSVNALVARHETLRTTFTAVEGQPRQVIAAEMYLDVLITDLTHLPEAEREAEALRLATEEAQRPFDLENGPLLRASLLRLGAQDHVGLFTVHHIIADGWSMGVLIRELAAFYHAFAGGETAALPPLPVQYADFAHWQRNWLQGEVLEKQLAYWDEQLGDSPPMLDLPTDRPRPAVQTANGSHIRFTLPPQLAADLEQLSREQGATLFMTLLATFNTLLYRYTGQTDISVGTPIANRTQGAIERLIGFFVNTLVMRTQLSGDDSFLDLLKRVREVALGAYAHQDLPFEMLVEKLQPERDLSHTPLFQVMFVLDNNPPVRAELPDLTLSAVEAESGTAKFDMTLSIATEGEQLGGYLEYNTDLFDRETMVRLLGHFETLLHAVVADPKQSIGALPLLTAAERQQLLVDWNATAAPFPDDTTIHALFEQQALRHPHVVAATLNGRGLTYDELNRRANRLAHYLQKLGVGPGTLVGLSTVRALEMIVGILGVLKAGGAYVPVDPTYPEERQAFMLQDSGARVLLTQEQLLATPVIADFGLRVADLSTAAADAPVILCLDADWPTIAAQPDTTPPSAAGSDDLAYVIYTSGSTGRPKGTMLRHRGLCNLATWQRKAFGLRPGESRILQFSPLSFDASVWETFMALRNGATLVLADQETLASGVELVRLLREERVTTVTLPPSMLAVMPAEPLPHLETIVAAGEACSAELVQRWGHGRQFVNAYGPTETTVCASMYECDPSEEQNPPIGRPIDNFQLYVLDANGQPLPVGVPGELHVGGVGLAKGYLHRPEMTARKFVDVSTFERLNVGTLYRTGDLVRYRRDGNLEFLGRIDHQVKVRGFRIELGEIEAALEQHPDLHATAVLAREDKPGDKRLVAYVVGKAGYEPVPNELRDFLRRLLPEYMVPLLWVTLESMPLTPNGKIDRQALPAPDGTRPDLQREYVAPRNETEAKLATIAAELLNVARVGVHDNFFDLGGHSLLATQFVSRVHSAFDVKISLRTLFAGPTVAAIAREVEAASQQQNGQREKIANVLANVKELSPEELKALLATKKAALQAKQNQ